jgi:cytochrome c peroxidase
MLDLSAYDAYLAGKARLTGQERRGMKLFFGDKAKCGNCHNGADFTDFTYDNLGSPRNPENPFYEELTWNPAGFSWVDTGLGGYLKSAGQPESVYDAAWGKQKVPTLRNVDLRPKPTGSFVKAYGHNGYFKSLDEIVHFYNTRDVPGAGWKGRPWPAPEVAENVNESELGDLGLTVGEEKAIVAFLHTLNDGYMK